MTDLWQWIMSNIIMMFVKGLIVYHMLTVHTEHNGKKNSESEIWMFIFVVLSVPVNLSHIWSPWHQQPRFSVYVNHKSNCT